MDSRSGAGLSVLTRRQPPDLLMLRAGFCRRLSDAKGGGDTIVASDQPRGGAVKPPRIDVIVLEVRQLLFVELSE